MANRLFSRGEARDVGERIGIDWQADKVDLEQFRLGLMVELEHGTVNPATDVTHDDELHFHLHAFCIPLQDANSHMLTIETIWKPAAAQGEIREPSTRRGGPRARPTRAQAIPGPSESRQSQGAKGRV